jgi:urea transport system ATP-binding protein
MAGRRPSCLLAPCTPRSDVLVPAALETKGLTVQFSGLTAVDHVSLSVERGELRVLLGANGAGKTTLMDLVSGKIKSTRGRVFIDGVDVTNWEEHRIARIGVGRKFQIPSVFRELTVRQNLAIASCESVAIYSNLGFGLSRKQDRLINETLELTGLAAASSLTAGSLSHGERQWLELGLVIVQQPKVLLLDEPTAGMTQAETHKTAEIIKRLRGQHTIVVVEHDMAFIREIAERITVMHLGRVLAEGDIASIENNPEVRAAYLGNKGIQ